MPGPLDESRYTGDLDLLEEIRRDAELERQFQRMEVLRRRSLLRARLLSSAVRVGPALTPALAESLQRVAAHLGEARSPEAYVFASPEVNAFVAEGSRRTMIAVSSGAVNTLSAAELDFLIGHEVGHAVHGHLDVPAEAVLDLAHLEPGQVRLLRSWQRASEISADRAGLLFCGSLEVAATALFKTLSGLDVPGLRVDPAEFSGQWDHLVEELMDFGAREYWQLSHPFPPLRMKALERYWTAPAEADAAVRRLLEMMEAPGPSAREQGDPMLARFQFWGGLYVVLADGPAAPLEQEHLRRLMPPGLDLQQVLAETGGRSELCLERFREARATRQTKLSSGELHRIVKGLVAAASVDGPINDSERAHLHALGQTLGLRPEAFNLVMEQQSQT